MPSMHSNRIRIFFPLILFIIVLLMAQPATGLVILEYFHQEGCINCEKTDPVIETIRIQYHDRVRVESVEINEQAGVRLLMSYGVTEIPLVVINRNKVLTYREITLRNLDYEIGLAEQGAYPVPEDRKSIFNGNSFLELSVSYILGLVTGFSPCLLGSLVVLIAAAGSFAATGKSAKFYPVIYGGGIITAYLIIASGILFAGIAIRPDTDSRLVVYGTAGLIVVIAGLIQMGFFHLPHWITSRTSVLISCFHTIPGIFLLGIIFAVLFAPCAIAPFLVLIEAILMGNVITPAFMILAFSAGILTPFVVLTILHTSVNEARLLLYAGIVQKISGLVLFGFGIWLILLV
jgi:cytochrome c-type biogenesis protein